MVKKVTIIVSVIILFFIFASLTFAADKNVVCTESGCSGFDGALFAETNIVPGDSASKTFSIKNETGEKLSVTLSSELKNQGSSDFLQEISAIVYKNGSHILFSGGLNSFFETEVDLGKVENDVLENYEIELAFPDDAGNEYQNKAANFSLSLIFEGEGGEQTSVLSGSADNSSSNSNTSNQTPAGSVLSAANSMIGQVLGLSDTSGNFYPLLTSVISALLVAVGVGFLLASKRPVKPTQTS